MKNSHTALFWWTLAVLIGGLLFLLAYSLILIMVPATSIGRGYYVLGLLAIAVVFAYLAMVTLATIIVRRRILGTNAAAARRWTLIMISVTILLPAAVVLIIAVFGGLIGEFLSRVL